MPANKPDIATREDIYLLVSSFYKKVRNNDTLAPFFDQIVDWEAHFEKLTDFWQSSLFLNSKYLGNPLEAHVKVDKTHNNSITEHEKAQQAKYRARKMSTFLFMNIFQAR